MTVGKFILNLVIVIVMGTVMFFAVQFTVYGFKLDDKQFLTIGALLTSLILCFIYSLYEIKKL